MRTNTWKACGACGELEPSLTPFTLSTRVPARFGVRGYAVWACSPACLELCKLGIAADQQAMDRIMAGTLA